MELMAFQKVLDESGGYIAENAALLVRGRISVRDEKEPQLMVDSIRPLSDPARARHGRPSQGRAQALGKAAHRRRKAHAPN